MARMLAQQACPMAAGRRRSTMSTGYDEHGLGDADRVVLDAFAYPKDPPADWLRFHLAHAESGAADSGDPNCAILAGGRYHLHYIYKNEAGYAFAHVSSPDLVTWRWHPTTLEPRTTGHGMFSGTAFHTKEGRPAIIYHGFGSGRNQVAIARDNHLEEWFPAIPIEPIVGGLEDESVISNWDPDAWLEGDTYFAVFGGFRTDGRSPASLLKSTDLESWEYVGPFFSEEIPEAADDGDVSCPNFFQLGEKYVLLCISHNKGCRYYVGEWRGDRFEPESHHRMNWNDRDFFAPESLLTADGRRVMWAWCNFRNVSQAAIQSLPRELALREDGTLAITPLRELARLRSDPVHVGRAPVCDDQPRLVPEVSGDDLEIAVTIDPGGAREVGVSVYCDSEGRGGIDVLADLEANTLSIGTVTAPLELGPGEAVALRIFLDKHVIEVFANDRQAMVACHGYDSAHLSFALLASGGDAEMDVTSWRMGTIYE
jgi:sucrose-6-phosphate hydrolase SacC (GH32 family)